MGSTILCDEHELRNTASVPASARPLGVDASAFDDGAVERASTFRCTLTRPWHLALAPNRRRYRLATSASRPNWRPSCVRPSRKATANRRAPSRRMSCAAWPRLASGPTHKGPDERPVTCPPRGLRRRFRQLRGSCIRPRGRRSRGRRAAPRARRCDNACLRRVARSVDARACTTRAGAEHLALVPGAALGRRRAPDGQERAALGTKNLNRVLYQRPRRTVRTPERQKVYRCRCVTFTILTFRPIRTLSRSSIFASTSESSIRMGATT